MVWECTMCEPEEHLGAKRLVPHGRRRHHGRRDSGHGGGGRLELVAVEVGAADDDDLLGAARHHEPPAVQEAEVARLEPAVGLHRLGVRLRVVVVPAHHAPPADLQVAHLALSEHACLLALGT